MRAKLGDFTVFFDNSEEYHQLKREIFTGDSYYFETDSPAPWIIDAGAHLGLATLYFKKLYPLAQIVAVEPNPAIIPFLEKNIFENQLEYVEVLPKALAATEGTATFYRDSSQHHWYSTAGFLPGAWDRQQKSETLTVETMRLSELLTKPVDLLKLDIEGAETDVLTEAQARLGRVHHLLVEFHPHPGHSLKDLLDLLKPHFSLVLWKNGKTVKPHQARGLVLIEGTRR